MLGRWYGLADKRAGYIMNWIDDPSGVMQRIMAKISDHHKLNDIELTMMKRYLIAEVELLPGIHFRDAWASLLKMAEDETDLQVLAKSIEHEYKVMLI